MSLAEDNVAFYTERAGLPCIYAKDTVLVYGPLFEKMKSIDD